MGSNRLTPRQRVLTALDDFEAAHAAAGRDALARLASSLGLSCHGNEEALANRITGAFVGMQKRLAEVGVRHPERTVTPTSIHRAVTAASEALGLFPLSKGTNRLHAAKVRHAVWYALRTIGKSLSEIGRLDVLGTADHTSVLSAVRKADKLSTDTEEGRSFLRAVNAATVALNPRP